MVPDGFLCDKLFSIIRWKNMMELQSYQVPKGLAMYKLHQCLHVHGSTQTSISRQI